VNFLGRDAVCYQIGYVKFIVFFFLKE